MVGSTSTDTVVCRVCPGKCCVPGGDTQHCPAQYQGRYHLHHPHPPPTQPHTLIAHADRRDQYSRSDKHYKHLCFVETFFSGFKGRCHSSYLKVSPLTSDFFDQKNLSRQKIMENFQNHSDLFNEIFIRTDESVNKKKNIFCGKSKEFTKSELELEYSDISEPGAAYLIEYRWQHRRRARKLKIGFQFEFR